ncbi:MAG: NAD(P)H-dependent oxidoreductase subunit E [Armatimonadota bacterium]
MACECSELQEATENRILNIIASNKDRPGPLIPILDEIQRELGWLPKWALVNVSKQLAIPVANIFGVVSFYSFFRLIPPGRTKIQICMGTACYVRGSQLLLDALERKLEVKAGETTGDQRFTLESVRCVGACSLAPVVMTGEKTNASVTVAKLDRMLDGCDK